MSEVNLRMGRDFFERQCPSCGEWVPASSETQQFTVPHECGWITMMRKAARCDELEVRVRELEAALEAAEWVTDYEGTTVCPWCGASSTDTFTEPVQHYADCPRQLALGKARGE